MTTRLWLLTFATLVACKDEAANPPSSPKVTTAAARSAEPVTKSAEPPAPEPPAAEPTKPIAGTPGPAYLGVSGTGLVRVAGGKAKTLIEHKYPIYDIVIDHRGIVYASAIGGAWSIIGDKVTELPKPGDYVDPEHLAIAPDGVLWTLSRDGVYRWDRKAWTPMPKTMGKDTLLRDITVDRAGRVWVATTHHLWRFDGTAWIKQDNKFTGTKEPYFDTIVAGPAGEVYTTCIRGVFVNEGDVWRKLKISGRSFLSMDEIAVGNGLIATSGGVDDVALGTAATELRHVAIKKTGAKTRQADVMAVDGSGRTWLRTDNGVVILDRDGKLAQQWTPGTVAGITGKIETIAVAGNGPELPKLTDAARGTVTGKVVSKGKPVAGAPIEICTSPAAFMMTEKTPCTGQSVVVTSVTAADGTFKLENVPVGSYGFAVKPKRTWFVSSWGLDECCTTLENGQTYDIGSINLEKLE